jgi:uroporphyrinogen-III synthase
MQTDPARTAGPRASGWRVALTGKVDAEAGLAAALVAEGAVPLVQPLIAFEAVPPSELTDDVMSRVAAYQWLIFTSATAVTCFARLYRRAGSPAPLPALAAVGPATARALRAALGAPALIARTQTAEGLAAELVLAGVGGCVLLPVADIASPRLAFELRSAGATVETLTLYRTMPGPGAGGLLAAVRAGTVDVILLASPSAARTLANANGGADAADRLPPVVCIGPSTADEAARLGLEVAAVAARHDRPGLLAALLGWIELNPERRHAAVR